MDVIIPSSTLEAQVIDLLHVPSAQSFLGPSSRSNTVFQKEDCFLLLTTLGVRTSTLLPGSPMTLPNFLLLLCGIFSIVWLEEQGIVAPWQSCLSLVSKLITFSNKGQ